MDKPGHLVAGDANVEVAAGARYVGRGGEKLEGALRRLGLSIDGIDAIDVGASTGGFTDCLLQNGARSVTALDVGKGQLDWGLRNDPRVHVREGVNVRYLEDPDLRGAFDLATIDVSFISLRLVLAPVVPCLRRAEESNRSMSSGDEAAPAERSQFSPEGRQRGALAAFTPGLLALVKPQFEVGRGSVGRGGIVRDPDLQLGAVLDVARFARSMALVPDVESGRPCWSVEAASSASPNLRAVSEPVSAAVVLDTAEVVESPISGAEGNREFFVRLIPRAPEPWPSTEALARAAVLV